MSKQLFPHQAYAVQWMIYREKDKEACGGLLCDEMGLGKTLTTIRFLSTSPVERTLVLGPLAVLGQWVEAIREEGLAVYTRNKRTWVHQGGDAGKGSVYVANYDKLLSEPSAFAMKWDRIVCDEAHILRNSKGRRYTELKQLKYTRMWLLTGTPIVNAKQELGGLVSLFRKNVESNTNPPLETAKLWMGKYALCRTADQLRDKLPGIFPAKPTIHEHVIPFLSEDEETFYRGVQGTLNEHLKHLIEEESNDTILMLQLLLRLRQISVHPQIYINARKQRNKKYNRDDWVGDSTKVQGIIDILSKDAGTHGYVIFCNFKEEISLLKARLSKESCVSSIEIYDGSLNQEQRATVIQTTKDTRRDLLLSQGTAIQQLFPELPLSLCTNIESFLPPRHTVLLAQIQSAGTGLNLQHMDRVLFTSPWWTAALMDQAIARVVRVGQTEPTIVHHLGLEEDEEISINIDKYINIKVETKRMLCKELLDAAHHTIVHKKQNVEYIR